MAEGSHRSLDDGILEYRGVGNGVHTWWGLWNYASSKIMCSGFSGDTPWDGCEAGTQCLVRAFAAAIGRNAVKSHKMYNLIAKPYRPNHLLRGIRKLLDAA